MKSDFFQIRILKLFSTNLTKKGEKVKKSGRCLIVLWFEMIQVPKTFRYFYIMYINKHFRIIKIKVGITF